MALLLRALLMTLLLSASLASVANSSISFPAIFVFGDSLSDVGNCARSNGLIDSVLVCSRTRQLPYGSTFPGRPFTRFSDGRLIVDLLALYLGLPLINPYLNNDADFSNGVNYAFTGGTALDFSYLTRNLIFPITDVSIGVQLSQHLDLKARLEASSTSKTLQGKPPFNEGLYIIEIGGNDYIAAFNAHRTPSYVISNLIPLVVQKIRTITEGLYNVGARNFLFLSITPLGCSPSILSSQMDTKDEDGCLEHYNLASYIHGVQLFNEVKRLRKDYPNATFSFLDYYGAYKYVLTNALNLGFTNSFDACCGAGPNFPFNYNILLFCNHESFICANPNAFINWDGTHFTDAFNFQIFHETFVTGKYIDSPFLFKNLSSLNN